jgi:anhydro-N-acetylmuramic acid kinase
MNKEKVYTVIGLMSGTSLDGIDAALIKTDGANYVEPIDFITEPYDEGLREELRACLGKRTDSDGAVKRATEKMTLAHAEIVKKLLAKTNIKAADVDLIGFHGQTIFHDPDNRFTWQIGDGELLACETDINVVNDFRSADVAAGGEGAPFLPLYHRARAAKQDKPIAILNLGGVGNVTWLGAGDGDDNILAFDTGPANAMIDDFVKLRTGQDFDEGGKLADKGWAEDNIIGTWMDHEFFRRKPPKSLDRNVWSIDDVAHLSDEDGVATLALFTVEAVCDALRYMPQQPKAWYVTGGGRKNPTLMGWLANVLKIPVEPVEALGWNGDALEAEGFAYLAVRSVNGLPLSLPQTTNVEKPVTGGVLHTAPTRTSDAA